MTFTSFVGQDLALTRLGTALTGGPGHAYLLTAPRGSGRTPLARAFAQALLCMAPSASGACENCPSCRYFSRGVHPDYRELDAESGDKSIRVEQARRVAADLALLPQISVRKVCLIHADELNEQGHNALLKSLEEPPGHAVFILTATSPKRLPATVASRCQLIRLARNSPAEIERILLAKGVEDGSQRAFLARFAGGLPGLAVDLAGDEQFAGLRQDTLLWYDLLITSGRARLLTEGLAFLETNRDRMEIILAMLGRLLRDRLLLAKGSEESRLTHVDRAAELRRDNDRLASRTACPAECSERLIRAYAAVQAAERGIALNAGFETLACRLSLVLRKELADT